MERSEPGSASGSDAGSDHGARASASSSDAGSDHGLQEPQTLRPLPLQRSPEFGPDTDFEALLAAMRANCPDTAHAGRTTSDHSDYAEGVNLGDLGSESCLLETLEARDAAVEGATHHRLDGPIDTLHFDGVSGSQSMEI